MRKIRTGSTAIIIMTAIISAALGYVVAYATGQLNMYHSNVRCYCHVLLMQSSALVSEIDSFGVNGLIDAIEQKGDDWAGRVRDWQPHARDEDKKAFSTSLERWEEAKKKLEELRSSIPDN
jgi:hypothetical protein